MIGALIAASPLLAHGFRYSDGSNVIEVRKIVMADGQELYSGSRASRTPVPVQPRR